LFAISSLGVYGIIMSGWASNSKYAFLGALRSAAQMVSYEVSIGFIIVTIVVCCGSFNLQTIIESQKNVWFIIPFFPLFLMFFISALAETNRHPFDLPEAEAELVSGYNVEYSAMGFALFSLGEYANMLLMSSLCVILFLGGWLPMISLPLESISFYLSTFNILHFSWFGLKICLFVIMFVWARAILPRYRYDQLMSLGWKIFLPIALTYFIFVFFILISLNSLPY
jgi:NADH-quinone oxidoreductase subunit H